MNSPRIVTSTIFAPLLFALTSATVFAANDTSVAILRQEFGNPAQVTIEGPLTGSSGCEVNRGPATDESFPACELQVRDEKSGTNYKIKSNTWVADDARTLYQAGVAKVFIQGHITGSNTLNAESIQKTN